MASIIWRNDVKKTVIRKIKCGERTIPIGAGTPFNANGEIANDGTAIGISSGVIVYPYRCHVELIIGGCVDERERLKQSGIELTHECKSALKNIKFVNVEDMEGSFGGGADWNQNDASASDYVKNRPFWTDDPVETVLFDGEVMSDSEVPINLIVGQEYVCTLDGVEYVLTAWEAEGEAIVGSESLVMQADYVDTEPPFFVGFNWFFTVNEGDQHTLKVVGNVQEVHKIDQKYLPDSFASNIINAGIYYNFCSAQWNTDGAFEPFELSADEYRSFYAAVKWGLNNNAAFYDFAENHKFNIDIREQGWYEDLDFEVIEVTANYYQAEPSGIVWKSYCYIWYLDENDVVWGECKYESETID